MAKPKEKDIADDDNYGIEPAPQVGSLTLIQKHGLEPVLKRLQKATPAAIEKLITLLDSTDEKIAIMAADMLLKHAEVAANQIDTSMLQRVVAEIKYRQPSGIKEVNNTPIVDFGNIQDVN